MRLRKGTPGKGGESRFESFCYSPVGHGLKGSFSAHLAGEPYWCEEAHEYHERIGPTKPCVHWMTDGAVDCTRCRKQPRVVCLAWVPLYRCEDGQPILVIVHKSAADLLAPLKYPDSVIVGRVDSKASVFVKASETRIPFKTDNELRKNAVCVEEQLLNLWKIPELDAWVRGKTARPTSNKGASGKDVVKTNGKPFDRLHQAAANRYGGDAQADGSDVYGQVLRDAVKRGDGPSTNGNHDAKGDK